MATTTELPPLPVPTTTPDNDLTLTLARVNDLTLHIPGDGLTTSNALSSEPPSSSVSCSSSGPPSPNPLLSESNTSSSTAASSNTTIKTSASSSSASSAENDTFSSPLLKVSQAELIRLETASADDIANINHTTHDNELDNDGGIATPLSSNDGEDQQIARSTASLPTSLNVRFAPLPELAPRKRRSAAPLGMAARKQLMRRRRNQHGEHHASAASDAELDGVNASGEVQMSPSYTAAANAVGWTEEEIGEFRRRQEAIAARQAMNVAYVTAVDARIHEAEVENEEYRRSLSSRARRKGKEGNAGKGVERSKSVGAAGRNGGEELEGDVRKTVFGRIVKGASKTLFKKISNRELAAARQQQMLGAGNGNDQDEGEGESSTDDVSLRLKRQQSDSGLKSKHTGTASKWYRAGTATPPPPIPLRPILLNGNSHVNGNGGPRVNGEAQPEQGDSRRGSGIGFGMGANRDNSPNGSGSGSEGGFTTAAGTGADEEPEEQEEEEGRVWEEEIGQTFPLNVGQTETFVEGRGVYSTATTSGVESGSGAGAGRSRSATPPSPGTTTTSVVAVGAVKTKRMSGGVVSKVSGLGGVKS
ncbi:hypothetical protein BJ165DRAFT_1523949 [Panaeolus papilionaceus]|nr:hypothetical protein BJ165DRAFT_1523949 [Panaeolus papilionaceus]